MDKRRILLMDDEEIIREVTSSILDHIGYDVTTAAEGKEAIELYKEAVDTDDPYDVVMLDLCVPKGMGGEATIKKLMKIDPDVKAIVFSGYYDEPIMANYSDYGFRDVIAKPYNIQTLAEVLNRLITCEV